MIYLIINHSDSPPGDDVIQRSYADLIAKRVVIGDISSRKSPRQSARD